MLVPLRMFFFFFFNDTATTEIYTLSLHDALPISSPRATRSSWTGPTRCRSARAWSPPRGASGRPRAGSARPAARAHESIAAVHPAAGRHLPPHRRDRPGRPRRLPTARGLRPAPGRLPDHAGTDLLPRGEPRRDGLRGHRPARAPVRPDARAQANDVDQLVHQQRDHAAARPEPPAPHRGPTGA